MPVQLLERDVEYHGNDCYSAGEREWMEGTQDWRARRFEGLFRFLTRYGIRADHITWLSFVTGCCFLPLWLLVHPAAALAAVTLHVLLDGIDGGLARYQKTASGRGSFVDTVVDQSVFTLVMLTLMQVQLLSVVAGTILIFVYALVVTFAMVRNALNCPYSWLVRPRFYVYGAIMLELTLLPGLVEVVCWVCLAVLSVKAISGFRAINSHLETSAEI